MEFEKREIFENLSGIYCIVNKINNKVYIGQTKQKFVKRYWHHLWCLRKNKHDNRYLQKSFNKYGGQNFKFIVIHVLCTNEDINELEKNYIKKYNSFKNGYNLTLGGDGALGCKMPKDYVEKMRERNRIANLGKKHSEETKRIMSSKRIENLKNGQKHNWAKITKEDVIEMRTKYMNGELETKGLPKFYNIDRRSIKDVLTHKTWKNIYPDGWLEFVEKQPKKIKFHWQ